MGAIIRLVPARRGRAFEATDRLNRTFHLGDVRDGRSGRTPKRKKNPDQSLLQKGGGHTAATSSPHGAAQGLLKATGLLVWGPVGKPNTDTVYSQAWEHCWERENKPLSGSEKKSWESKHKNCKDHPPDVRLPFGNK